MKCHLASSLGLLLALTLALGPTSSRADLLVRESCTGRPSAVLQENANVFLGGLMGFHQPGGDNYGCGSPAAGGMQAYEAVQWALKRLNQDQGTINGQRVTDSYIPGVKLGMLVRDTCQRSELAVDSLVDLFPAMGASDALCLQNTTRAIVGAVSATSDSVTGSVTEVLGQYQIPTVSYTATSPSLSDQARRPYFMRTVPSDTTRNQVMLSTLSQLGWTNVAVVYTDQPEGTLGFRSLSQDASNAGVCISQSVRVPAGSSDTVYRDVLRRLVAGPAKAVVYFGDAQTARGLMNSAINVANSGNLQWLMPDTVGTDMSVVNRRDYARGILTVAPASRHIAEFEDYWVRLSDSSPPSNNPWFKNWYMTVNRCRLAGVNYAPYNTYNQCQTRSESQRRSEYQQSPSVEPAVLAVYTYAKAIKNARNDLCRGQGRGLCSSFLRMTSEDFYKKYLMPLDFTFGRDERIPTLASALIAPYRTAKRVRFNAAGDIMDPTYAVYNYNNRNSAYSFKQVGTFSGGTLSLNRNQIQMYDAGRRQALANLPESRCPAAGCPSCLSGGAAVQKPVYLPGDVVIGGLFSVHLPGTTSLTCGRVNTKDGAELLEAFLFGLRNAESLNLWRRNVKLGAIAFDDCSSPQLASNTLINFLNGEDFSTNVDVKNVYGYTAGNDDAITLAVASLLGSVPAPQIGYKPAPAMLSDQMMFPNFAELLPGKADGLKGVTQLLQRLGVSHVRLVHDNSEDSAELLEGFRKTAMGQGICVGSVGFSDPRKPMTAIDEINARPEAKVLFLNGDFSHFEQFLAALNRSSDAAEYLVIPSLALNAGSNFMNKKYNFRTLSWTVKTPSIDGWTQHLRSLTPDAETNNPWLKEWYQAAFNCFLDPSNQQGYPAMCENTGNRPITAAPGYKANPYAGYVIMAVGALARAIDKALQQYCGASYTTVCSRYVNAADRTQTIMKFLRDDPYLKGTLVNGFDVAYMRPGMSSFTNIGDIQYETTPNGRDIRLTLGTGTVNSIGEISAACGAFCQDCLYMYENQASNFIPGEILLGGLFNIHSKGDSPYSCNGINAADGYQYTEAFKYAIQKINDRTAPINLRGIQLGGLMLDTCSSDLRIQNLVSSVYAGAIMPRDNMGRPVDVSKVKGWLTFTSGMTRQAAYILGRLGVGVISPGASSITLKDRTSYPTLFRAVPADDKQAQAMAGLLEYLKWPYIATVNEPSTYGRTGIDILKKSLKKGKTCSIASYEWTTDGTADEILNKILATSTSVVVLFGGQEFSNQMMAAKQRAGRIADKIVFITSERVADMPSAVNTLSLGVDHPSVPSFDAYMAGIVANSDRASDWFNEAYQMFYKCNLPGGSKYAVSCGDVSNRPITNAPGWTQDARVLTVISSVYALAKAIDLALIERCGINYNTVCKEFLSADDTMQLIVSKMDEVSVVDPSGTKVEFVDREHDRGYVLYRYGSNGDSTTIGGYKEGVLRITDSTLADSYGQATSTCPGSCLQCQYQQDQTQDFTSMEGQVYFAGLFDVHAAGQTPFSCGDINVKQGWQLVEAFNFAISRVNNKTGMFHNKLPGVKIGGIGLDTCSSPNRASNLVANIQSGLLPLMMGNKRINPDSIDVYIGAYDSDTSAAVANFLNVLGIPQLSYGATSTAFKDTTKYPSFLRTVPADDKLARAVVALLKNYGIQYIQVVHSPGTYGDDAAAEFTKLAAENGICVAQAVRLAENGGKLTGGQAEQAARTLLNKPQATVIVTFISTVDINTFLKAVERVPEASRFHFVGSETWSNRPELLEGVNNVATDALTLGVETADLSAFDRYLKAKTRGSYRGNPWFDEYYEAIFDCSLTPGSGKNPRECPSDRDVVLAPGYTQDQYVLYTVNAVYSAALGLDYALRETCGDNYLGVCDDFRNAPNRRQLILEGMRRATFQDATNQRFDFAPSGESNRGYHIYTARKTPGSANYYYENVGSYNDTDLLKIRHRQQFAVTWSSDCSAPGACEECTMLGHRPTRAMEKSKPNLNLVGFFDVHNADPKEPLKCGSLNINYGFQNMLAFFFAIDNFNRDNNLGVQLGGLAIDTCSSPVRVTRDVFSLLMGQGLCEAKGIGTKVDPSSIVAVIPHGRGSAGSVASMLGSRQVAMVSPTSGNDKLTGSSFFLSTIPPDSKRAEALSQVIRQMGWSYMTAVHSDSAQGRAGMESFFNSSRGSLCVGQPPFALKAGATAEDARNIIKEIVKNEGSNVVALYTNTADTKLLLEAARDLGHQDRFIFVNLDSTASSAIASPGLESVGEGAITLRVRNTLVQNFLDYVMSLTVAKHGDIPDDWFDEFWQMALKCKLENSTIAMDQYPRVCGPTERLTPAIISQDEYVLQTIIATYITAHGLLNADDCQSSPLGIAGCLREKGDQRRQLIFDGVKSSSWRLDAENIKDQLIFTFGPEGYGNTGLDVVSRQKIPGTDEYEYKRIGTWTDEGLELKKNDYQARRRDDKSLPRSSCPATKQCSCYAYNGTFIGIGGTNGGGISPTFEPVVGGGESLNANLGLAWGIAVAALAGLGILVTLCAFIYLLIFYPIKGGTSALGFLLMFAVLCMYTLVFAFLLSAVPETCGIRRFCLGLVYALAFSCMLVKVLNTWRLGAYFTEYMPSYQRLAHPCSLIFIALGLTLVQVIIGVEWLILVPPAVQGVVDGQGIITRCYPTDFHNEELVLSCIYVMVLMLLTLIFAAVTWDSEENHRESRWLLITTCFTICILVVWTTVSTLAHFKYRDPAIAIALLVNATIILMAIFVRKIVLLQKYQKESEEERKSQFVHDDTKDHDFYSTLYNNQAFDTSGDTGSRKGPGSHTGSGVVYVYDGTTGIGQTAY